MRQDFQQRRETVLGAFNVAVVELNELNLEIDEAIKENEASVLKLQAERDEMKRLRTSNSKTIAFFSKIFKS